MEIPVLLEQEHSSPSCSPASQSTLDTVTLPLAKDDAEPFSSPMAGGSASLLAAGSCEVYFASPRADVGAALAGALRLITAHPEHRSPLFRRLQEQLPYESSALKLWMSAPDCFERLATRVRLRDAAKGCIDPDVLLSPHGRDFLHVAIKQADEQRADDGNATDEAHADANMNADTSAYAENNAGQIPAPSNGETYSDDVTLKDAATAIDEHSTAHSTAHSTMRYFCVPAFTAHLVDPLTLYDSEACADAHCSLWDDGTWTGTLVWDSAVVASEVLLRDGAWRHCVRDASVLELGCGLGLPGLICHALGASRVTLTDRPPVAQLVREGVERNAMRNAMRTACGSGGGSGDGGGGDGGGGDCGGGNGGSDGTADHGADGGDGGGNRTAVAAGSSSTSACAVDALSFEWDEAGARALLSTLGGHPDVIIACDCIFSPFFGDAFLLLRMVELLASEQTRVLVALERRPGDGADRFFECARREAGMTSTLLATHKGTVVCEMRKAGTQIASC